MTSSTFTRRAVLGSGAMIGAGLATLRPALAQLQVDITRGQMEPMPIAVSPFAGDPRLGNDFATVIGNDLAGSGLFRVIDRGAYIQGPEELGTSPRFADWRQINAQALVSGVVTREAGGLAIEFRLWDILSGQQLKGLRYTAPEQAWRRIAHKIADQVYERLTGEPGYFDSWIAYTAMSGAGSGAIKRIALMDQDGANLRYLTDGRFLALNPRIAPDTRQLAFSAFRSGPVRIYMQQLSSGRDSLLGNFPGMSFAPRFSPDGSSMLVTIARDGNSDIFKYTIGSRQLTRLTDSAAIDTSPSYAPDGSRICFTSDRGGTPQLYVMGSGGGGGARISYGSGRYGDPAWSPKGDLIAFTNIKGGAFHIGVMRPDGSGERLITQSVLDEAPAWSPNGRRIVFARGKGGGSRLFTIDATGYDERPLTTATAAASPDWSRLLP